MRLLSIPRARWPLLALVALLAVTVPGLLALEAWSAARRHRQAAERALRTHATSAALTFRQRFVARAFLAVGAVLREVGSGRTVFPDGPLPAAAQLRRASDNARACGCGPALEPLYFFRLNLADSALDLDGPPLPSARRRWLVAEVTNLGDLHDSRSWDFSSTADTLAPHTEVVYLTVRRGPTGVPRAVYGFAVDLRSLRETMRPLVAEGTLLPVDPWARLHNDSVLSVVITQPRGEKTLDLSPRRHPDTYATTIPGGAFIAGWDIRVALDPRTAPPILIGGLPPSRTGLLITLVAVTALLIAATLGLAWRLVELARLRAGFVASVSHELRTPLAQILLFAESLNLGRMQSRHDVRAAGKIITGEARRLMQLVDNVLLFGRAGGAAPPRALAQEPLAPLVSEVVESFAPIAAATDTCVRVTRVDHVTAMVDRSEIRQILLNLLDNAVKYGPAGQTVNVGLALVGDRARLWVEDEGPGIPPADRERVWRPFVRMARDVDAHIAGSGIGLSVVHELVERNAGSARIDSTPMGGACVVVELPAVAKTACAS